MDLDIDKVVKSAIEGYVKGRNWPDEWESHGPPGGPWVHDDPSQLYNDIWRFGWRKGHECKLAGKDIGVVNLANLLAFHYAHELEFFFGRRVIEECPGCGRDGVFDCRDEY